LMLLALRLLALPHFLSSPGLHFERRVEKLKTSAAENDQAKDHSFL
jgi:hypothetical protein